MVVEKVKEKFDDWYNLSTEELVGIVGMKWQDDRKCNFVTHSFFDQELLDKGYSLRKLALRECLYNLYDNTHEDKTNDNPDATKEIDKILASVMKQIEDL